MVPIAVLMLGCSSWEVEHRIEIAASPQTVWRLLTDLEGYPAWNPYSPRVEGKLVVGEVVLVEAHLEDEVRLVENVVTEIEEERTLCWQSRDWYSALVRGTRCRFLEPAEGGGVRLRHHEVMEGPLAGLIERLYRERIEQGMAQLDRALKAAAEETEREG